MHKGFIKSYLYFVIVQWHSYIFKCDLSVAYHFVYLTIYSVSHIIQS